ncbi:hypothetical protein ACI2LF_43780 [Kribbella sp. NPDC020789]
MWRWLGESAGDGDHIGWRIYQNPEPAGRNLLVVWDRREYPCSKCRQSDRWPCPVTLDPGDTVRVRVSQHDCGAELAPARHQTAWLDEIHDQDAVQSLVRAIDHPRQVLALTTGSEAQ